VIDALRRRGREVLQADPAQAAAAPDTAVAPDEALHWKRSEAALRRDLQELPAALREAFELLKLEGLSSADAAEVLGITRGMVKIRAHRAIVALRRARRERERERATPGASEGAPTSPDGERTT
jgi:RNA polymerase sigma-70 factor (ECF subfamily)